MEISLYWLWALTSSRMLLVELDSFKVTMASVCLSILSLFSLFYLGLYVPSQNEGGSHTSGFWMIWLKRIRQHSDVAKEDSFLFK